MAFAAPIWLLGLLPWAVLVLYLLPGKGTPAVVPFLGLWTGSVATPRRTARRWPGLAVLFALLSLLLAIIAAARPTWFARSLINGEVSIVLDRGATMSLPSVSGKPFRNVISKMEPVANGARVTLVPVPGEAIETTGDAWARLATAMPPTAIPTHLDQVIANQLRQTRGPVFVLSDQNLNLNDPRIVQILPEAVGEFLAITAIGARSSPRPQVMVRLENHSDLTKAVIIVRSGAESMIREISLPAKEQRVDQFFDFASLGETVVAWINVPPQAHPWSRAYLVRQSNGSHLAVDPLVDDSIHRIAEIYAANRPAVAEAQTVLISARPLERGQSGIWIAGPTDAAKTGEVVAVSHEVTRNIGSWPTAGSAVMPAGFKPVVSIEKNVVIAVRDDSARQVWINADLREWEKTPDFVVFFANAFDWIGGIEQSYTSVLPAILGDDWQAAQSSSPHSKPGEWPGIYKSAAGGLITVNAGEVPRLSGMATISRVNFESTQGRISMTGAVILGSLTCLLVAALTWVGSARLK